MPQQITLNFVTDDPGLNLTGVVNFPNNVNLNGLTEITVRGLAMWRHSPANIVHLNERMIEKFNMPEKAKKLTKIGMNYIGIKAHSDILIAHIVRTGRNGNAKVQAQLTKFFKAIGASSLKFSVLDVPAGQEATGTGDQQ
jgi:hypothetical protein